MSNVRKLAHILHLSDIQFGKFHRFPNGSNRVQSHQDLDTTPLSERLVEDIEKLSSVYNIQPNFLILSGDVAEWGLMREFEMCKHLIEALIASSSTDLQPERVIIVPGNHDINRDLCQAYFLECKANQAEPELPYLPKFRFYDNFVNSAPSFFSSATGDRNPVVSNYIQDFGLIVTAFNSCLKESHKPEDHVGYIGRQNVRQAIKKIQELDREHQAIRIAVLHHNVIRNSGEDNQHLIDWNEVRRDMLSTFDIILHGHRHHAEHQILQLPQSHHVLISGAGSVGLSLNQTSGIQNHYQLISIEQDIATIRGRTYELRGARANETYGEFTAKFEQGSEVVEVKLRNSLSANTTSQASSTIDIREYLNNSSKSLQSVIERSLDRIGSHIPLECDLILSGGKRQDPSGSFSLEEYFNDWLGNTSNRLILIAGAGGGKTTFAVNAAKLLSTNYLDTNSGIIPIYIDLSLYNSEESILSILLANFRSKRVSCTTEAVKEVLATQEILLFLDAFDEYDIGPTSASFIREFIDFHEIEKPNIKIVIGCRDNHFRSVEDILVRESRQGFQLCPVYATVIKLKPLSYEIINEVLSPLLGEHKVSTWIYDVVSNPLTLKMVVSLLKSGSIQPANLSTSQLTRHELYEQFITNMINWDLRKKTAPHLLDQRKIRKVLIRIAEVLLDRGEASLMLDHFDIVVEAELGKEIASSEIQFLHELAVLGYEGGRIKFVHKAYREYLYARKIANDIAIDERDFQLHWFTRNERHFIVEMLSETEIETLFDWLSDHGNCPASNYAAFILGGVAKSNVESALRMALNRSDDPLLKINCCNSLAGLGVSDICSQLLGAVAGHALEEGLIDQMPEQGSEESKDWFKELQIKYERRSVMILHLCEMIEALGFCGLDLCKNVLDCLKLHENQLVREEVKSTSNKLLNC